MTAMGGRVEMLTVASIGDCCLDTRGEAKPSAAAAGTLGGNGLISLDGNGRLRCCWTGQWSAARLV